MRIGSGVNEMSSVSPFPPPQNSQGPEVLEGEMTEERTERLQYLRSLLSPVVGVIKRFVERMSYTSKGIKCPICEKFVKRHNRPINSSMARSLLWLVRFSSEHPDQEWVDVPRQAPKWLLQTKQLSTVSWWGLIESRENTDSTKKNSGYWRPTEHGRAFVSGEISVPTRVYTYNGEVLGFSPEHIRFRDALASPGFNYEDAMSSEVPPPEDRRR